MPGIKILSIENQMTEKIKIYSGKSGIFCCVLGLLIFRTRLNFLLMVLNPAMGIFFIGCFLPHRIAEILTDLGVMF